MAEVTYTKTNTLNVRIKNKYDSYENWVASKVTLEPGEIAIAHTLVDSGIKDDKGVDVKHPALLMKVGDGTSTFAQLPWLSAKAADVADWAKAAERPVYKAADIQELGAFIEKYVGEDMKIEIDTDTQYQIVANGDNGFKLQSKGKAADAEWADVGSFTVDFTAVNNEISGIKTILGSVTNLDETLALYDTRAITEGKIKAVSDALAEYKEANDEAVKGNADAIDAIVDGKTINTFKAVETALAGKQAAGDYATKTEAQGYADAKDDDIAAAKKAGDDAQAGVDALNVKVDLNDGETVKGLIGTAKEEAMAHVTTVNGRLDGINTVLSGVTSLSETLALYETVANVNVFKGEVGQYQTTNDARVKLIEDDYLTSADKTSLQEQIDLIMDNPNTESVKDSIAEFTAYIEEHGEIAEGFRTDINKNKEDIAAIAGDYLKAEHHTALNNLIEGLDGRLEAAEGEIDDIQEAMKSKVSTTDFNALSDKVDLESGTITEYVSGQLAPVTESISNLDASLAAIAKSGNVDDLVQTENTYIVFDCGTASTLI